MSVTDELELLDEDTSSLRMGRMGSRVFDAIRQAIVQLKLRPGNLLSEADVARQLGVSRQPVREAFIKLAEVGLVEVKPQRGTFVMLISIRQGRGAMPAYFGVLKDRDILDVIAYLRTLN